MAQPTDPVELIFRALSDPTRRSVFERLVRTRALSVSKLAEPFDMSLPSFVQHLEVLEDAGLIGSHKWGRTRRYHLSPNRMRMAESWFVQQRKAREELIHRRPVAQGKASKAS